MLVRLLLTFWMLITSALGPALCCCVPLSLPTSRTEAPAVPAASVPAQTCRHCRETKPVSPENEKPTKKCPCDPDSPGQKNCPCRDHHLTPAITDDAGVRLGISAVWALALTPFVVLPVERTPTDSASLRTTHTGPPPLGGVELLHRLHILVC